MLDRQKFMDVASCLKCPVIFEASVEPLTQNDLLVDRRGIASSSLYVVLRDKTLIITQQVEARYTILQGKGVCVVYTAELPYRFCTDRAIFLVEVAAFHVLIATPSPGKPTIGFEVSF